MTESATEPGGTGGGSPVATRRRYRRLLVGTIVVGVLAALGLRRVGYPLVGEAVYWLGVLGFLAVWWASPVTLFDERDRDIERRASQATLLAAAVSLPVVASAARLVTWLNLAVVPSVVWGALYGYAALFGVFGLAYGWLRRRR